MYTAEDISRSGLLMRVAGHSAVVVISPKVCSGRMQLREADVSPSRVEISFQTFRLTCWVVGGNLKVCVYDGTRVVESGPARDE